MERSIAEGPGASPGAGDAHARGPALGAGLVLVLAALVLYLVTNPAPRWNIYTHFVWQADAFLQGRAWIPYPLEEEDGRPGNAHLQDVYPLVDAEGAPTGRVLLPFPPLPALVLAPFVAVAGLRVDQELIGIGLGAAGVGAAWWMLGGVRALGGRRPLGVPARALVTVAFAASTAWWWTAAHATTWYLAHLVATTLGLLAVGIALRADPRSGTEDPWEEAARGTPGAGLAGLLAGVDRRQVLAGFLLGLAVTARLPLILGAPFLALVGAGGSLRARVVGAGLGGFAPVAALLLYTYATTGSVLHPGYDHQYQLEANGYRALGYNPAWAVEDVRYIPQNTGIMFGALPAFLPDVMPDSLGWGTPQPLCTEPGATRGLFDRACPLAVPRDIGTSILLTSPVLLLGLLPALRLGGVRLVAGAGGATVAIVLFNLAHFSQGWVQWGYRFANDALPFLLPLVALGAARVDGRLRATAVVLTVAGIAVNAWGIWWGRALGW